MGGTAGSPATIRLARDALGFIEQVEAEARRHGSETPALHHWVLVACGRRFLARSIASGADVRAAATLVRDALEAGAPGPRLVPATVLAQAREAAWERGDSHVRAWHLVLAVLQRFGVATRDREAVAPDAAHGPGDPDPAVDAVRDDGCEAERPAAPVPARRRPPPRRAAGPAPRPPTPLLDQCGTDWTAAAARGELPPMVGRDPELQLVIEALCRPTKPNVLLVGETGVGKSALVEGLAGRMAAGTVPAGLRGRPLIALNLAEVTRDSRYYGVVEQRMSALLAEARAVRAILFLDEGHAMVGAGGREGTGDIAQILKPALARGDLSFISATTEQEYQRFIAPNAALERRFSVVHLAEPGREAVLAMLAAYRDAIARTHGVTVDDAALDRLLVLTALRVSHRREPDRSRDLLDQAIARAIATGSSTVVSTDVEAVAAALSGAPDVTEARLAALERRLIRRGLLADADAAALVDRLGTAFAGLALRPRRPRATMLVLRSGGVDGTAVAEALATAIFGGPERVLSINVGGIGEPGAISGFLGTTQGFVGHGAGLPIHGLAERPHSVLLLQGIDAAHDAFRSLLARAIRDGSLTDAMARRIGLTQAIVVLEATPPHREGRRLGFGAGERAGGSGSRGPGAAPSAEAHAAAAVGVELAGECDLVVVPPDVAANPRAWVEPLLDLLAGSYRTAGVNLAWEPGVVALLADDLRDATAREREHDVERRLARLVRPLLGARRGPLRVRVRLDAAGLVADAEA